MIEAYFNGTYVAPINYVNYKESEPVKETFISRQTANGQNILDPSPAVVQIIKGKTVKSTNLIPFPYYSTFTERYGVQITIQEDGGIYLKGTATADMYFNLCKKAWNMNAFNMNYATTSFTHNGFCVSKSGTASTQVGMGYDDRNGMTFIVVYGGGTVDGVVYPMLNEGSTAKPFVPYFSGLKHANFKSIKSTGKQLFRYPYDFGSNTRRGVEVTVNDDGSIKIVGTATARVVLTLGNYTKDMLPAGTYYVSGTVSGTSNINIECYKGTKYIKNFGVANRKISIDWNGYDTVRFYYNIASGATVDGTLYPILNFGDTAQPFEPYKVEEYTDGNTYELAEYDYINPQTSELVRQTKTLVLEGTEEWFVEDTLSSYRIGLRLVDNASHELIFDIPNIVSNLYETVTPSNTFDGRKGITIHGNILYVYDGNYATNDISLWKSHLAELYANGTPLVVEYKLVTPTITPLTDYPKEYTADKGGSETVEQGETDNSEFGAICEITIQYFMPSEENILMLYDIFVKEE